MPNPENLNPPWKAGQSGNPKGRPPKLVNAITGELKSLGYERVPRAQVNEAIELLLNLPEQKAKDIASDKEAPLFLRIVARQMFSSKGFEAIQNLLDRAHGKPTQQVNSSVTIEKPIFNGINLTAEE